MWTKYKIEERENSHCGSSVAPVAVTRGGEDSRRGLMNCGVLSMGLMVAGCEIFAQLVLVVN